MNTDQTGDEPSIIIAAKSETPESPRPIIPPQPANIPILELQTDPNFNLVTSHTNPPYPHRDMTAIDQGVINGSAIQLNEDSSNSEPPILKSTKAEDIEQANIQEAIEADTDMSDNIIQSTDNRDQASASVDPTETVQPEPSVNPDPEPQQAEQSSTSNPFTEADDDEPKPEQTTSEPVAPDASNPGGEVNYQALLDQIVASNTIPTSTTAEQPSLPTANPGLPARPPPQDQPNIHPNYAAEQDIRSYHYPQAQSSNASPTQASFQQGFPNSSLAQQNGIPQANAAPFHQQPPQGLQRLPDSQAIRYDDEKRWPLHIQQMYEEFLKEEEIFTKDGRWDQFPAGSRLFVGNLPTEVVTKRDIYHCFYRFGKIAQISIKQAYGFVQFMDKEACTQALIGEQGAKIKDRPMHLEVSKPPKSRGGGGGGGGNMNRNDHRQRRSRSPENRRPESSGMGRNSRMGQNYRDEPRRRDDYRPNRSPSPRGFRDRNSGRYNDRSRSPRGRGGRYGRSPSPRRRSLEEDDGVPFPRRLPRDVPDVQLLLIDEVDKPFIDYLEKAFRDRNLRTAVLYLPQVPIQALVKRQIVEGVQAIIKLDRAKRNTGRIPIQVFDRTLGAANVRFEEYDNLDANTAAELVVRAKAKELSAAPQIPPAYGAPSAFPPSNQYNVAAIQQAVAQHPNLANIIPTLDGPALQAVLGALQQPGGVNAAPQHPAQPSVPQAGGTTDIAALLGSLARQPPAANQPAQYGGYQAPPVANAPQVYGGFQQGQQQPQQGYGQQQYPLPAANPAAANVSSVLDRLGRWKQ